MHTYGRRPHFFDLDGTLLRTQALHARAESAVLALHGVDMSPEEITSRYAGISDRIQFAELLPMQDTQAMVDLKWSEVYRLVCSEPPLPLPGMLGLVQELHARLCPIAVASASPRAWIETCLAWRFTGNVVPVHDEDGSSFGRYFGKSYVSARDCPRGKPHPDVFLAARQMVAPHVDPSRCVVVGDAAADVLAGLAAGMEVLYLSPSDTQFDGREDVQRFTDSAELAVFARACVLVCT